MRALAFAPLLLAACVDYPDLPGIEPVGGDAAYPPLLPFETVLGDGPEPRLAPEGADRLADRGEALRARAAALRAR
ncbi:hypothetical protein [Rhodosalinus sp.]|uniref:hypothetical protein n=1 Tax=Rhodosalinus sp. TaxID=2047741 RepID=UPI003979761B